MSSGQQGQIESRSMIKVIIVCTCFSFSFFFVIVVIIYITTQYSSIHHFIFNLKIWTRFYYADEEEFLFRVWYPPKKNVICRRFIKRVFLPTSYVENMWRELQKQTWMGHFSVLTNTHHSHPASTHSLNPQFNS